MVICKFFQRGICRYGSHCVNDHSYGQQYNTNHSLENEIRNTITSEVETFLQGKQWLLSCFAPIKEKPNLPDFVDDLSFEEIRLKCYQSKESGTLAQYIQELQTRMTEAKQKYQMLHKPNREMLHFLTNFHSGNVTSNSTNPFYGSNSSNFGNSTTSSNSIFNQTTSTSTNIFNKPQTGLFTNNNLFGSNSSSGNTFGNKSFTPATNIFGSNVDSNTFGLSAPENKNIFATSNSAFKSPANVFVAPSTNTSTNIFAQAANNIFSHGGLSSQQNNSFLLAPPTTSNSNVFGTPNQSTTQPIFGQSGNVFNNNSFRNAPNTFISTAPNIFGNAQNNPTTTFANMNAEITSTFGSMPVTSSNSFAPQIQSSQNFSEMQNTDTCTPDHAFGAVKNQYPFTNGTALANRNIFQTTQESTNSADNPFFSNSNLTVKQNSTVFAVDHNHNIDNSAYSKIEELSAEELRIFQTDDFKIGKIPIKPPTYEMCNRKV